MCVSTHLLTRRDRDGETRREGRTDEERGRGRTEERDEERERRTRICAREMKVKMEE